MMSPQRLFSPIAPPSTTTPKFLQLAHILQLSQAVLHVCRIALSAVV